MNNSVVENEELAEMLLNDFEHEITIWTYLEIWLKLGRDEDSYPKPKTYKYLIWGQNRGKKLLTINRIFERMKKTIRLTIAYGTDSNGEEGENVWRAVPKNEVLNWHVLESAKKMLSPMINAVIKAECLSLAEEFSLTTRTMFKANAAMINSVVSVTLKNAQSIDGMETAQIKELQEWHRRKIKVYQNLLEE